MKIRLTGIYGLSVAAALLIGGSAERALSQEAGPAPPDKLSEVIVTGSRIAQSEAQREQPLSVISSDAIEQSGLADIRTLLQRLTTGGQALNTKFNSSGNFGYPPDGGGIGAGSAQVSLRNLDSKRVLVLVDGIRWVNESSASGVSGSAGVVNIITKKKANGVAIDGYVGDYGKGGMTKQGSVTAGGSTDKFSAMFVASYFNQAAISSSKWWQSDSPEPLAGQAAGSSAIPQGRYTFCDPRVAAPAYGSCTPDQANFYDVTLNNGTTTPSWNPANPTGGTYHNWSGADRFNFAPYNDLLTPSERKSIFTNLSYQANDYVEVYLKGLYNNR